jgi:hypothetical protein
MKIKNIFFCHAGIHGVFVYLGAIKELYKQRDKLDLHKLRIYGSSSGGPLGLICLLVLNDILVIDDLITKIRQFFERQSARSPLKFTQTCVELLEELCLQISDPSLVLSLANKHLLIGVSQQTGFQYISRFTSVPDILHSLLLSSNLVLLATYPAYDNNRVVSIDGGFMMSRCNLPRKCLVIYTQGIGFPECVSIPDNNKQDELIKKGIHFIKNVFTKKNMYQIDDEIFNNYSESFIKVLFLLQTYIAIKHEYWKKRIDEIKYKHLPRTGTSSDTAM